MKHGWKLRGLGRLEGSDIRVLYPVRSGPPCVLYSWRPKELRSWRSKPCSGPNLSCIMESHFPTRSYLCATLLTIRNPHTKTCIHDNFGPPAHNHFDPHPRYLDFDGNLSLLFRIIHHLVAPAQSVYEEHEILDPGAMFGSSCALSTIEPTGLEPCPVDQANLRTFRAFCSHYTSE